MYDDNYNEEWGRYNWFPQEEQATPPRGASGGPPYTVHNPPPPPSPGMSWMLNPNTGEFQEIPVGTVPPWGLRADEPNEHYPTTDEPPPPPPRPPRPPGGDGGGGVAPDSGGFSWPSYSMPSFDPGPAFSYRDFAAPTSQDVLGDQGFQFRMDQGRKALESSAAGRGVLRSGGTLKDILNYGQNFASQEYGNVYDRALKEYDTNRRNAWDTWNTGYTGRRDQYGFDQNNAQFGFNSRQRQAELDFKDAFDRWAKEGDWYASLGT